jgi:hypothetical protein
MRRIQPICFLALVCLLGIAPPRHAVAQDNASARIELAGQQITLAHKLIRAICFAEAGIDRKAHLELAIATRDTLDATLLGLIDGNADRGITAETDGTTLTLLSSVQKVWNPLRKKVDAYLSGEPYTIKNVTKLSFKADSLQKLWSNIISRYELKSTVAGGRDNLDLARLIETASHQSALIQQAGKLSCLVRLNGGPDKAKHQMSQLETIIPVFHLNTFGLAFSYPMADLPIPPNDDIQNSGFANWQTWVGVSDMFDATLTGDATQNEMLELSHSIEFLNASFDEIMPLYTKL